METTSTTIAATSTTSDRSREQEFKDSLSLQLDLGDDHATADAITDVAQRVCSSLDSSAGVTADDADNETAASDADYIASINEMTLGIAMRPLEPEVAAVVLNLTGAHLCPQHRDILRAYARDLG